MTYLTHITHMTYMTYITSVTYITYMTYKLLGLQIDTPHKISISCFHLDSFIFSGKSEIFFIF